MQTTEPIKKVAGIAGATIVLALCLPWGICWLHWIPTPGKAGLLLAFVATVMPLVWDYVDPLGRAGLILTLVVLFAVEYRAIDKEHNDYAEKQREARREERESFQKVLDNQNANIKKVLGQEDEHFEKTLKQNQQQFAATIQSAKQIFAQERETFVAINKPRWLLKKQTIALAAELEQWLIGCHKEAPPDKWESGCTPYYDIHFKDRVTALHSALKLNESVDQELLSKLSMYVEDSKPNQYEITKIIGWLRAIGENIPD